MDPAEELLRLVFAYRTSQAIHVAAVLGISDHLAGSPLTAAELATATASDPAALYRLMRALAAAGVYRELPDGRFESTPMGEQLRADADSLIAGTASFIGQQSSWRAWGALEYSVRTGQNAFEFVHGENAWDFRASHPEESAIFDAAMTAQSRRVADAVLDAYDFSPFATVVDLGGGRGAMLAAILQRNPELRGTLLDLPHVVAGAPAVLARAGVASRCEVVAGDLFDSVPPGADAYVLKAILHDWQDDETIAILRNCRQSMRPDSTLIIMERVLSGPPYGVESIASLFSDLNMLVGPGGLERTEAEFAAVLAEAGLRLIRVVRTTTDVSVVEAGI